MSKGKGLLSVGLLLFLFGINNALWASYTRTIINKTPYELNYEVAYYGGNFCPPDYNTGELDRIPPHNKKRFPGGVCRLRKIYIGTEIFKRITGRRYKRFPKVAEFIPSLGQGVGDAIFKVWAIGSPDEPAKIELKIIKTK